MTREIEELLPFYANRTLEGDELAMVEKALGEDAELRSELDILEKIRSDLRAIEFENSPGELGLMRLQSTIREERQAADTTPAVSNDNLPQRGRMWRYAAIAACLLLALQTAIYLPSSGPDDMVAAGVGGGLVVTFAPDATEEDIRNLLLDIEATIIDGPSALGVYTLSVADEQAAVAVEALREQSGVVESADLVNGE